jgi:hypothetical protein
MSSTGIKQANKNFEHWLERQLNGEVITDDLKKKRKKMSDGPFPFLRATYWRWSETILQVCPDLQRAPPVLAVGDIHLENYGTWRDAEGRLVWGVNDFDEAANMPYGLDLVRLAASALLKQKAWDAEDICAAIIEGYRRGLAEPRAFVLDEGRTWLLNRLAVSTEERQGFWDHMDNLKPAIPPARYRAAIVKTMPEQKSKMKFAPRSAGLGSLGRAPLGGDRRLARRTCGTRVQGPDRFRLDPGIRAQSAQAAKRRDFCRALPLSRPLVPCG